MAYLTLHNVLTGFMFNAKAARLTDWPVKTAVMPACLRDLIDFMWDVRVRSLSGGFKWLNDDTTADK